MELWYWVLNLNWLVQTSIHTSLSINLKLLKLITVGWTYKNNLVFIVVLLNYFNSLQSYSTFSYSLSVQTWQPIIVMYRKVILCVIIGDVQCTSTYCFAHCLIPIDPWNSLPLLDCHPVAGCWSWWQVCWQTLSWFWLAAQVWRVWRLNHSLLICHEFSRVYNNKINYFFWILERKRSVWRGKMYC